MIFYHSTTEEAASGILTSGFKPSAPLYVTLEGGEMEELRGVWVSDQPTVYGETLLRITLPGPEAAYEKYHATSAEDAEGPGYGEWFLPVELIEARGIVERAED